VGAKRSWRRSAAERLTRAAKALNASMITVDQGFDWLTSIDKCSLCCLCYHLSILVVGEAGAVAISQI
jgi:hypothetical protein